MSDPYKVLADAIKRERKLNNLTQTELAQLSKTGINFISQLERGKKTLRFSSLLSVMRVLGLEFHIQRGKGSISISEILKGRDETK